MTLQERQRAMKSRLTRSPRKKKVQQEKDRGIPLNRDSISKGIRSSVGLPLAPHEDLKLDAEFLKQAEECPWLTFRDDKRTEE